MACFVIEDWMISEMGLGGHELLAFALIHSVTQGGDGCWYGGYDRLAERIGAKQRGTIDSIRSLVEKGLVEKDVATISGRVRNVLKSTVIRSAKNAERAQKNAVQKSTRPLQKMQTSSAKNAENNKDNIPIPPSGVDTKVSSPSSPKGVFGPTEVVSLWKEICTRCSQPLRLSKKRENKIRSRLAEFGSDAEKMTRDIFTKVNESDFLCNGSGSEEHKNWKVTIDWVFENDSNWIRILEGQFDNRRENTLFPQTASQQPQRSVHYFTAEEIAKMDKSAWKDREEAIRHMKVAGYDDPSIIDAALRAAGYDT